MGLVLFTSIINLLIGFIVLARNKKNRLNQSFFILIISVILWLISNELANIPSLNPLLFTKLTFLMGNLVFFFISIFSYYLIKSEVKFPKHYFYYLSIPLLTSFIFIGNGAVLSTNFNGKIVGVNYGHSIYLYYVTIIYYLFINIFYFVKAYIKSHGIVKNQMRFMAYGLFISILVGVTTNVILPALGIEEFYQIGPHASLIFIIFTAYAIIKHRLMDIRMVVARSVSYALLLLVLAGFYAGSVLGIQALFFPSEIESFNLAQGAVRTVIAVIMVFIFQPLRKWITKVTDKIFYKNVYNPEAFLDTLSHTIGSSIVLIELLFKTLNHIVSEIKITRGMIIVLTDAGHIYTQQSVGYKDAQEIDEADIVRMAKDGVLVYDELEETSRYKHLLRKYDASVAIPIKTDSDTEGLLLLGEKLSGDMFSATDLRVFEIIAPELAVAINNSKSYEKIEKFNVTLRQEVKKATAELQHKNEQLRELDKAKDEFISMASHQLRTPLTAIKGYLSMLLEGDAGEIKVSQYDFVNEAFSGANRMVGLINDLLNVSRMETGRFFLEPVEVDLDKMIGEEIKQLSNNAKEKHLYLKYEKKGSVPNIQADETKIRQVVMNFIDNAIYYTTAGGITVHLRKEGTDVVFEVSDTGIGVPKAAQKQLFTKFYRADNARHVRPDGTGLGIYLAKKVIDDHKGKLIFKSTEGKGSVFGFRFPIKSHLSTKRLTAPVPTQGSSGNGTPAIGELAAGIGVSADALAATSLDKNTVEKTPTESAKELIAEAEIARDTK